MIASILIGRGQNGPGITPRILKGKIESPQDRRQLIDNWSVLHDSVVPAGPNEMVFKLSRHFGAYGESWTWLGCYKYANFSGIKRDGTYVGSGILATQAYFDPEPAARYILDLVNRMIELTSWKGEIIHPVAEIDAADLMLDHDGLILKGATRKGGLQPGNGKRLFIDQSTLQDGRLFNQSLLTLIGDAQREPGFASYGEMIIGNTDRLAARARSSMAHSVYPASDWHAGILPAEVPASPATRLLASSSSHSDSATRSTGNYGSGGASEASRIGRIEDEVQRLQDRLSAMEAKRDTSGTPYPYRWEKPGSLTITTVAILALVIGFVSVLLFLSFRSGSLPLDPGNQADAESFSNDNAENAVTVAVTQTKPSCLVVALPSHDPSPQDRSEIKKEKTCLKQSQAETAERLEAIRQWEALNPIAQAN